MSPVAPDCSTNSGVDDTKKKQQGGKSLNRNSCEAQASPVVTCSSCVTTAPAGPATGTVKSQLRAEAVEFKPSVSNRTGNSAGTNPASGSGSNVGGRYQFNRNAQEFVPGRAYHVPPMPHCYGGPSRQIPPFAPSGLPAAYPAIGFVGGPSGPAFHPSVDALPDSALQAQLQQEAAAAVAAYPYAFGHPIPLRGVAPGECLQEFVPIRSGREYSDGPQRRAGRGIGSMKGNTDMGYGRRWQQHQGLNGDGGRQTQQQEPHIEEQRDGVQQAPPPPPKSSKGVEESGSAQAGFLREKVTKGSQADGGKGNKTVQDGNQLTTKQAKQGKQQQAVNGCATTGSVGTSVGNLSSVSKLVSLAKDISVVASPSDVSGSVKPTGPVVSDDAGSQTWSSRVQQNSTTQVHGTVDKGLSTPSSGDGASKREQSNSGGGKHKAQRTMVRAASLVPGAENEKTQEKVDSQSKTSEKTQKVAAAACELSESGVSSTALRTPYSDMPPSTTSQVHAAQSKSQGGQETSKTSTCQDKAVGGANMELGDSKTFEAGVKPEAAISSSVVGSSWAEKVRATKDKPVVSLVPRVPNIAANQSADSNAQSKESSGGKNGPKQRHREQFKGPGGRASQCGDNSRRDECNRQQQHFQRQQQQQQRQQDMRESVGENDMKETAQTSTGEDMSVIEPVSEGLSWAARARLAKDRPAPPPVVHVTAPAPAANEQQGRRNWGNSGQGDARGGQRRDGRFHGADEQDRDGFGKGGRGRGGDSAGRRRGRNEDNSRSARMHSSDHAPRAQTERVQTERTQTERAQTERAQAEHSCSHPERTVVERSQHERDQVERSQPERDEAEEPPQPKVSGAWVSGAPPTLGKWSKPSASVTAAEGQVSVVRNKEQQQQADERQINIASASKDDKAVELPKPVDVPHWPKNRPVIRRVEQQLEEETENTPLLPGQEQRFVLPQGRKDQQSLEEKRRAQREQLMRRQQQGVSGVVASERVEVKKSSDLSNVKEESKPTEISSVMLGVNNDDGLNRGVVVKTVTSSTNKSSVVSVLKDAKFDGGSSSAAAGAFKDPSVKTAKAASVRQPGWDASVVESTKRSECRIDFPVTSDLKKQPQVVSEHGAKPSAVVTTERANASVVRSQVGDVAKPVAKQEKTQRSVEVEMRASQEKAIIKHKETTTSTTPVATKQVIRTVKAPATDQKVLPVVVAESKSSSTQRKSSPIPNESEKPKISPSPTSTSPDVSLASKGATVTTKPMIYSVNFIMSYAFANPAPPPIIEMHTHSAFEGVSDSTPKQHAGGARDRPRDYDRQRDRERDPKKWDREFDWNREANSRAAAGTAGGDSSIWRGNQQQPTKVTASRQLDGFFQQQRPADFGEIRRYMVQPPPVFQPSESSWLTQQQKQKQDVRIVLMRKLRGLLNKLTLEKFDCIYTQIVEAGISRPDEVSDLLRMIFEKAVSQHNFIQMYSDLCLRLKDSFKDVMDDDPRRTKFRKLLIDNCENSFEESLLPMKVPEGLKADEGFEYELLYKHKMKGNMIFVGELLKKGIISQAILLRCVDTLLSAREKLAQEESTETIVPHMESLCSFLTTVGPWFDHREWRFYLDFNERMKRIEVLQKDEALPFRIRCLLKDVLEDRAANWVRNKHEGPARLAEIHQQAFEKEQLRFRPNLRSNNQQQQQQQPDEGWEYAKRTGGNLGKWRTSPQSASSRASAADSLCSGGSAFSALTRLRPEREKKGHGDESKRNSAKMSSTASVAAESTATRSGAAEEVKTGEFASKSSAVLSTEAARDLVGCEMVDLIETTFVAGDQEKAIRDAVCGMKCAAAKIKANEKVLMKHWLVCLVERQGSPDSKTREKRKLIVKALIAVCREVFSSEALDRCLSDFLLPDNDDPSPYSDLIVDIPLLSEIMKEVIDFIEEEDSEKKIVSAAKLKAFRKALKD